MDAFNKLPMVDWIITSPPYYGMQTYIPDQWLRLWFLGEEPKVKYSDHRQLEHTNPEIFISNLHSVWKNLISISRKKTNLVIRFGGIPNKNVDPLFIVKNSLAKTGWKIKTIKSAGFSSNGRRQADHFSIPINKPMEEYDVWAMPE